MLFPNSDGISLSLWEVSVKASLAGWLFLGIVKNPSENKCVSSGVDQFVPNDNYL